MPAMDTPRFATATMAELYLAQGKPERAREIYAQLVADEPGNARAASRLRELSGGSAQALEAKDPEAAAAGSDEGTKMGFKEQLEKICGAVDGSLACSLMGFDGIPIEHHESKAAEIDVQTMLIEYSGIMGQIRNATQSLSAGDASEVTIRTEKITAIARPLTSEYFLVMALSPEGNTGKARYVMRLAASELKAELAA